MVKKQSTGVSAAKAIKRQPKKSKPTPELITRPRNKQARRITLGGLVLLAIVLGLLPVTRYAFLNSVGVRTETSFTVVDGTTALPLQNAEVKLGNLSAQTGHNGIVKFAHLKLGNHTVTISKIAFATLDHTVTLGLSSNVLGNLAVKAAGTQYGFTATDYVTGKPVTRAEAVSGPSSAPADSHGKIVLTVVPSEGQSTQLVISAVGYRSQVLTEQPGATKVTAVQLVPLGKDIFVSQTNGQYDIYKSDLDGQNRELLLAASGLENSNITLVPSPDQKKLAVIDTRDNVHDASGYLLYTLAIVDVGDGSTVTLDHGDYIQAIGWLGTRFVYEETVAGAGTTDPGRTKIVSYDYVTKRSTQLAMAAQFNAVTIAKGTVYYAVAASDTVNPAALYQIGADGKNHQPIFGQEVWTILRRNYTTFDLETPKGWYSYTLSGGQPKSTSAPANYQNISFVDSPDGTTSVWSDNRGGQGVLLSHNLQTDKDMMLTSQVGLTAPIVWLGNNLIIYRVSSAQETADYVISTQGGPAHKINDVTATFGAGQG